MACRSTSPGRIHANFAVGGINQRVVRGFRGSRSSAVMLQHYVMLTSKRPTGYNSSNLLPDSSSGPEGPVENRSYGGGL